MIAASYGDGRDGSRQPVVVFLGVDALSVVAGKGQVLDTWSFDQIRLAEEVYRNQPARLVHKGRPDAVLRIDDADAVRELCRHIPQLRSRYLGRLGALPRLLFWTALATLIIAGAVYSLPRLAASSVHLVPMEWEQSLGRIVVRSLAADRCPGGEGQQALKALAARLSAAGDPGVPLELRVVRDPGQNAFAAPGGQIVILSGLIDSASTAEEVAGVLAHEIAHVTERHPMAGILRAASLNLVFSALLGDVTALGSLATALGEHLTNLSYSRDDEATADAMAVRMLNQADIRGEDFAAFFDHLDGNDNVGLAGYFSSHPNPDSRADLIAGTTRGRGDALSERQWRALQSICDS